MPGYILADFRCRERFAIIQSIPVLISSPILLLPTPLYSRPPQKALKGEAYITFYKLSDNDILKISYFYVSLIEIILNKIIMKSHRLLLAITCMIVLSACSIRLLTPSVIQHSSLDGYKYFYITPTAEKTSTTGYIYNGTGSSSTHSANPADIITGELVKRGYTRVPELINETNNKTFVINYGETGRRKANIFAYTTEVTLQFIKADTREIICISTAEGCGETEADDIRIAINRSINAILPSSL